MSTCYRFTDSFNKEQVVEAAHAVGLLTPDDKNNNKTSFCITDGSGCYVWAYHGVDGSDVSFERFGVNYNAFDFILRPLAEKLGTDVLSEHDDGYYEECDDD